MGMICKTGKFTIRVNGFEHPPVHAHVLHTNGKAIVYLNGTVLNSGVPAAVMAEAKNWMAANRPAVTVEWNKCNPKA
jgi:hypothetical protein